MRTPTVRHRILEFLRRRKAATASEISVALGLSRPTVRHHLGILSSDGRLTEAGVRARGRRGRPEKQFRLSDRLRGDNLGLLAGMTLEVLLQGADDARRAEILRSMGESLAQQIGEVPGSPSAKSRLVRVTQALAALNYEAGWEAGADGPRIVFGNCPYAAVIAGHPELCQMDTALLARTMQSSVQQLARIEPGAPGSVRCVFALRLAPGRGD